MWRLPHFLHNQLTDGGEVVSLRHWLPFTSRNIPGTHFYQRLSRPQGHSTAGRIRSIEKSNDLIGNQTHDLLACSIASWSFHPGQLKNVSKICYFPDGPASQYKMRNIVNNLLYHTDYFGMDTKWHFSAVSHGKGTCNRTGETTERSASKESL
jgi:hypothetical protein